MSEVFSPDRKVVLKVQPDKTVRLFDVESGEPAGPEISLEKKDLAFLVRALAIAGDNKTIVTGIGNYNNDWGRVEVWDASTGERIARYKGPPYLGTVFRVSFSRDGKTVSIVSGPSGGK